MPRTAYRIRCRSSARSFDVGRRIVKARLYATGLGQYAARLNGSPVTNAVLEPGQTSYWAEVDYRTYDVTRLLRPGSNVLGIDTGSGVYQQADSTPMGRYMFQPGNNVVFGDAQGDRPTRDHLCGWHPADDRDRPVVADAAGGDDLLVVVGRRGLRRAADARQLDGLRGQPDRSRLASGWAGQPQLVDDPARHDSAGRRPAPTGDGRPRGSSDEHQSGHASGRQHHAGGSDSARSDEREARECHEPVSGRHDQHRYGRQPGVAQGHVRRYGRGPRDHAGCTRRRRRYEHQGRERGEGLQPGRLMRRDDHLHRRSDAAHRFRHRPGGGHRHLRRHGGRDGDRGDVHARPVGRARGGNYRQRLRYRRHRYARPQPARTRTGRRSPACPVRPTCSTSAPTCPACPRSPVRPRPEHR